MYAITDKNYQDNGNKNNGIGKPRIYTIDYRSYQLKISTVENN